MSTQLFERTNKFVEKNGVAKLAFLLGLRDTGRVKNWIARKEIPTIFHSQIKEALNSKVIVTKKGNSYV